MKKKLLSIVIIVMIIVFASIKSSMSSLNISAYDTNSVHTIDNFIR